MEGTPDDNGIHQQIRPHNAAFLATIRGTAQRFFPFVRSDNRGFMQPSLFDAEEQKIFISANSEDTICIDEVMRMADG